MLSRVLSSGDSRVTSDVPGLLLYVSNSKISASQPYDFISETIYSAAIRSCPVPEILLGVFSVSHEICFIALSTSNSAKIFSFKVLIFLSPFFVSRIHYLQVFFSLSLTF